MRLLTKLPPFFLQFSILVLLLLLLVPSVAAPTTGPTTITTIKGLEGGLGDPVEGKGGYAQGKHWVIYSTEGSCEGQTSRCLFYASSTDGVSWVTTALSRRGTSRGYGVYLNTTHIFIARYNNSDLSIANFALIFGHGVLNTDGTISSYTEYVAQQPGGATIRYTDPTVVVSTTSQAFIAYQRDDSAGTELPYVLVSTGTDYNLWTTTQLSSIDNNWRLNLVPLTAGKVYIAYFISGALRGRLYDTTWGVEETASGGGASVIRAFLSHSEDTVYVVYSNDGVSPIRVEYNSRGAGGWGSVETVVSNLPDTEKWTSTYDILNRDFYVHIYNVTNNKILEYKGKSTSWGTVTEPFTTTGSNSSMRIASYLVTSSVNATHYPIGVFWTENDSPLTDLELRFAIQWSTGQVSGGTGSGGSGGTGAGPIPGGIIAVPDVPWEPFIALWVVQTGVILIPYIGRKKRERGNILEKL